MMRASIDALPEEIVREILNYALAKPLKEFFTQHRSGITRRQPNALARRSSILLVCKTWQRIGTPLLYASLCLGSREQTQAVVRVLKRSHGLVKLSGIFVLMVGSATTCRLSYSSPPRSYHSASTPISLQTTLSVGCDVRSHC